MNGTPCRVYGRQPLSPARNQMRTASMTFYELPPKREKHTRFSSLNVDSPCLLCAGEYRSFLVCGARLASFRILARCARTSSSLSGNSSCRRTPCLEGQLFRALTHPQGDTRACDEGLAGR